MLNYICILIFQKLTVKITLLKNYPKYHFKLKENELNTSLKFPAFTEKMKLPCGNITYNIRHNGYMQKNTYNIII